MTEVAHTHQGRKIRSSSNEATYSLGVSSREGKGKGIEKQGYAGDDAGVIYYPAVVQKSNRRPKTRFPNRVKACKRKAEET